jgi:hypothetical protein
MNTDYIRRINNQKREHSHCSFATGHAGLSDFAFLANAFEGLSDAELEPYLDLIDAMRRTHEGCFSCSAKILAFCEIFAAGRNLPRAASYREEYEAGYKINRCDRDYRDEVRACVERLKDSPA